MQKDTEYLLEGLMLKLKLQYFGHLMQRTDSLEKTLMLGIPGVANVAGNPPGARQGRGENWQRGAGWGVRSQRESAPGGGKF